MKLWNYLKSRLFVAMLPANAELGSAAVHAAMMRDPKLAEIMLRSNESLWETALQTFVMQKMGDIGAEGSAGHGLPAQNTVKYPILNQFGWGKSGLSGSLPKVSPFNLRQFSEYPPVRRAINAIATPILDMPWAIEPMPKTWVQKVEHRDWTLQEESQIAIATNMLKNPNHDDTWRTMIWQTLEDIMVGGFGALEVQRTKNPWRPYVLYPVDGSSIRVNAKWRGDPDEPRYSQSLGYLANSMGNEEQVALRNDELLYFRLQPRTNTPFGIGYVETAYRNINAWVGAVEYAERRASNSTPNFAIHLGENMDAALVQRWRQYWENEVEGYGKIPIIGGGRQPSVLQLSQGSEDELWLRWQELLIRYIAQAFNLSASTFALEKDVNRSTAQQLDADDWGAVAPVAYTISDMITNKLLHGIMGFRNLRFRWIIRDTDEMRQSEILEKRFQMSSITPNEIREHYDQPPLDGEFGNMIRSQLNGIEDSLPALAPSIQDSDTGDDPYVLDRMEQVIKKLSKGIVKDD